MTKKITSLPALACFRTAAEFESFSRAADHLNLTHGAVSRAVRLLEDDLGVALFERRNRAVFLTDAGRELAEAVAFGLDHIDTAVRRICAREETLPLTVSCEPTLMMRWLIPCLPAFKAKHPEFEVRLVAGGGPIVLGNGIDLALRRNDFEWPQAYACQTLFEEWIGPVCRPDQAQAFFSDGTLCDDAPRLHSKTRLSAWQDWANIQGTQLDEEPDIHRGASLPQEFEHFYFSLQGAVAGLGVAIAPWHLVQDDLDAKLLCAPQGFERDGSAYVLLSKSALTPAGQAFQTWLMDVSLSEDF